MSVYPGLAAQDYWYTLAASWSFAETKQTYHSGGGSGMVTWGRPYDEFNPFKHGALFSVKAEKFPLNPLVAIEVRLFIPHLMAVPIVWPFTSFSMGGSSHLQLRFIGRELAASACNGWTHDVTDIEFYIGGTRVWNYGGPDSMSGALYRRSLNRFRFRPLLAIGEAPLDFGTPDCDTAPFDVRSDLTINASWERYPGAVQTFDPIDLDVTSAPPAPSGACECTDTLLSLTAPYGTMQQVSLIGREWLKLIDPTTGSRFCACGDGVNGTTWEEHEPQHDYRPNQSRTVTDPEDGMGTWIDMIPADWGLLTSTLDRAAVCASAEPLPDFTPTITTATFATTKAPFRREVSRSTGKLTCGRRTLSSPCTNIIGGEPQPPPAYCGSADPEVCVYDAYVQRTLVDNCEQYDLHLAWQHTRPMWAAARGASGVKLVGFNYEEGFFRLANVVDAADIESAQVAVLTSGGCGIAYSQGGGANNVIKWVQSKSMGDDWSTAEIVTPMGPPQIFGKQAVAACDRITGWIYVGFYKLNGPAGWDFYRRKRGGGDWEFVSHFDADDIGRGALEFCRSRNRSLVFVYERGGNVYWRESIDGGFNWTSEDLIAAGVRPALAVGTQFGRHVLFVSLDDGVNVKLYRRKIHSAAWSFMSNIRATLATEGGLDWSQDGPNRLTFLFDQGNGLERLASTNFGLTFGEHPFLDGGI